MAKSWSQVDEELAAKEAIDKINAALRSKWVGQELRRGIYIIDIARHPKNSDIIVLCFNINNNVHKFVTWGFNPEDQSCYGGDYVFTVSEGLISLISRTGGDTNGRR